MRTDTHKEWTDYFRDGFPEEVRPADGGWEAVAGRMRRAATRRRAAIAAAVLALPLAGGVFFLASRHPATEPATITAKPAIVADKPAIDATEPTIATTEPATDPRQIEVITTPEAGLVAQITGSASESSVLKDVISEHRNTANEPSVLKDAESEHADMTNEPLVLRDVTSEHRDTANEPSVLRETESEHADVAKEPPVLRDADSEHRSALFPEAEEAPARRAHRLSVGLGAASTAGGAPTSATVASIAGGFTTKASNYLSNNFSNNSRGLILQKEYVHDLPLSFGINARYWLTDRLSLESGIEYSYLHSRLDDIHTVMHFAGIPLRVDYNLLTAGPVEFYTGLGGKVEKCLKASLGGMQVKERDLQWSGSFSIGAQSRLSRNAWIYVQPDISYYFTKTILTSYRTENRLGLTIRAGLRFDINN